MTHGVTSLPDWLRALLQEGFNTHAVNVVIAGLWEKYHPALSHEQQQQYTFAGVAGEAGEVLDIWKKTIGGVMPLNRDKLVEELGDLQYATSGLMQVMGISQAEINMVLARKLHQIYPDGYWDPETYRKYRRATHGGELK